MTLSAYSVAPEPEYMNKSPTASVKVNSEDEYFDMVIPIDPDDLGRTTDADVGVKFSPEPSAPIDEDNDKYKVDDPADGRTCNRP